MQFIIEFTGHENITSLHTKTIEITKESRLTRNGDCIVGVNASCGCKEIPQDMKKKLQDPKTSVKFSINVDNYCFQVRGRGHKDLILSHPDDIVLRKSTFVCPRTLAVKCDKASDSIPAEMIRLLQNPKTRGTLEIDLA